MVLPGSGVYDKGDGKRFEGAITYDLAKEKSIWLNWVAIAVRGTTFKK